jgi:hypothetical protein
MQHPPIPEAVTAQVKEPSSVGTAACCGGGALWGWSPPRLPADTALKRLVDRVQPRTGLRALAFFAAVVALLNVGQLLPRRADLGAVGLAALLAGGWCALNFWRCRHAHCALSGAGWLALAVFTFAEAAWGHSVIGGDEPLGFLVVLGLGLAFEACWSLRRGTNSIGPRRPRF